MIAFLDHHEYWGIYELESFEVLREKTIPIPISLGNHVYFSTII